MDCTSAACHRISTFLFFLALTFWLSSLSSSARLLVLREWGRPEETAEEEQSGGKKKKKEFVVSDSWVCKTHSLLGGLLWTGRSMNWAESCSPCWWRLGVTCLQTCTHKVSKKKKKLGLTIDFSSTKCAFCLFVHLTINCVQRSYQHFCTTLIYNFFFVY